MYTWYGYPPWETFFLYISSYYMPRARSQYIAEMRERFEVVDRVKASAEEKASLTKAIQEDSEVSSSPEVSPSKENTLKKEDVIKLSFKDPPEYDDVKNKAKNNDDDNNKVQDGQQKDEEDGEDEIVEDDVYEDVETGLKVCYLIYVKKYLLALFSSVFFLKLNFVYFDTRFIILQLLKYGGLKYFGKSRAFISPL